MKKWVHIFSCHLNKFQCQWKCCDGFTFFTTSTINERVKVFGGMSSAVAAAAAFLFVDFSFSILAHLLKRDTSLFPSCTTISIWTFVLGGTFLCNVLQQCTILYPSIAIVSTNFQHLLFFACIQRFHGFRVNLLFSITPKTKISSSTLIWIETLAHTFVLLFVCGDVQKKYSNINAL